MELKCETLLVAETPETRQHIFYFFTFFYPASLFLRGYGNCNNSVTYNAPGLPAMSQQLRRLRQGGGRSPRRLPTHWQLRRLAARYARLWQFAAILFREADPPLAVSRYVVIFQMCRVVATALCRCAYATSERLDTARRLQPNHQSHSPATE